MFYKNNLGFSLFELIITVSIISIIVSFAIPYFNNHMAKLEQEKILRQLQSSLVFAKSQANVHRANVVICSTQDFKTCQNQYWQNGYIIFIDRNRNKYLDFEDIVLRIEVTALKYGSLTWRGALSSPSLQFLSQHNGLPIGSNGSFFYCSTENIQPKRILLSKMGWIRIETIQKC